MAQKSFDDIVIFSRTGLNPRQNFRLGQGKNKYITIKNIRNNSLIVDENTDIIDDKAIALIHKRSQIKKGDVLFCSIGRLGDMYIIPEEPQGWDINESVFAFTLDVTSIRQKYFYYLFKSHTTIEFLTKNSSGSTFKSIKMAQLRQMIFDIPSLDEQDFIIKKLDAVSKIICLCQQQLAELDNLIKARFVEMFGDCFTNPKKWEIKRLEDIAEVGSSKRVFIEELHNNGIPFYRGTEIGSLAEGKKIIPELFISDRHYAELVEATGAPQIGDLLMPSICPDGRIWLVDTDKPFYFKDGRVLWVHAIKNSFNPVFLLYTLKDRIITDYNSIASGTTFAELKIFALKKCGVFNVPIQLQNQFAAFVAQVDKSKVVVQKALDEAQTLFDSLMQQYFG